MTIGKIIALVLGILFVIVAVIYIVSPEAIGGPLQSGDMTPQSGMWGNTVTATFTTIPLGVGTLVVPRSSAVIIFGILGVTLFYIGLAKEKKQGE